MKLLQVGILADTHNRVERTRRAVEILRDAGAEILVHCGDLSSPEIVSECSRLPLYFVFGNHDADAVPELMQAAADSGAICLGWGGVIEFVGKRIGVVHGHMTTDLQRVLSLAPDYLLTGHSHDPHNFREGMVHRINPGALDQTERYSVALLDLSTDTVQFLTLSR